MSLVSNHVTAAIAQLGERQTEDLEVPGSIPGFGMLFLACAIARFLFTFFLATENEAICMIAGKTGL